MKHPKRRSVDLVVPRLFARKLRLFQLRRLDLPVNRIRAMLQALCHVLEQPSFTVARAWLKTIDVRFEKRSNSPLSCNGTRNANQRMLRNTTSSRSEIQTVERFTCYLVELIVFGLELAAAITGTLPIYGPG